MQTNGLECQHRDKRVPSSFKIVKWTNFSAAVREPTSVYRHTHYLEKRVVIVKCTFREPQHFQNVGYDRTNKHVRVDQPLLPVR